jgi:integrating conjugative element membrane protein (TIGR03747 family)
VSDSATPAQRQQARKLGLIATLITLPFQVFGVLCGALLLSILIECIGMRVFWSDQSWHHAQGMLRFELEQLSSYFTQSALVEEPGRAAHRLVEHVTDKLFIQTGALDWVHETAARARGARQAKDFKQLVGRAYVDLEPYARAAGYTCLTFLVRLMVLCLTCPMFLTAAFVGLIDGLVRRDIRRFGAGRESGFVHHRAKAIILPLAVLPWVIYLALPVSVHPLLILLPSALLLSVAVNIAVGSFKKYL